MIHPNTIARVLVAVCACAAGATHAHGKDIDGQVFIVTAAGPAIKLALVEVKLFVQADIERHIRDIDLAPDSEGDHALVATSGRTLFNSTERYFWVVRLKHGDTKATLSNDNLTTSGRADSLVTTKE